MSCPMSVYRLNPVRPSWRGLMLASLIAASYGAHAFDFGEIARSIGKAADSEVVKNVAKGVEIIEQTAASQKEYTEQEEATLGAGMASTLLGAKPLVADDELQRYVNRVGRWLASQSERPNLNWHFGVIDTDGINAFTTPGGYVLITKGLWQKLRSESELAGVLAHEIAHVVRKHHLNAIRKERGKEALGGAADLLAAQRKSDDARLLKNVFKSASEVFIRGLDKDDEYEADRMGVVLAARAGYSPYGLVGVLQTLAAVKPKTSELELMTKTHPTPASRLDYLDAAMSDRLTEFEAQADDFPRFGKLRK